MRREISETMPPTSASSVIGVRRDEDIAGAALAAGAEVGHQALDRGVVALDHDRARDQRLDHAEPGEVGLGGEELQHRRHPRPHPPRPVLLTIEGLADALAQLRHDRVVGSHEALVLARKCS
jgi:hypothetical protein